MNDPQSIGQNTAMRARILLETGRRAEASALADRAIESVSREPFAASDVSFTLVLSALGRGDEQLDLLVRTPDAPFTQAARLWATGDVRGAADVFAALELAPTLEAVARLWAGRGLAAAGRHAEADVELLRAIELFRPLRAQRYVAEAEALLSTEAAATAQPG